jgi:hypothetical protein
LFVKSGKLCGGMSPINESIPALITYTKSGSTETGGTMTGVNAGKVSDTSIKLTNILSFSLWSYCNI